MFAYAEAVLQNRLFRWFWQENKRDRWIFSKAAGCFFIKNTPHHRCKSAHLRYDLKNSSGELHVTILVNGNCFIYLIYNFSYRPVVFLFALHRNCFSSYIVVKFVARNTHFWTLQIYGIETIWEMCIHSKVCSLSQVCCVPLVHLPFLVLRQSCENDTLAT